MKASERRLLTLFLVLAAVMGAVLTSQRLLNWDHRLDRRERELELSRMESEALLSESAQWQARREWLEFAQPKATSGLDASKSLLDTLRISAEKNGLEITKTQLEEEDKNVYHRQFGVSFSMTGKLPDLLVWLHAMQSPEAFYVVPQLRITPNKENTELVDVQVRIQRWYAPEFDATPPAATAQTR